MPVAEVTTTDSNDSAWGYLPPEAQLIGGTKTFRIIMVTAVNQMVKVVDDSGLGNPYTPETSPSITVNPGSAVQLRITIPNEVAQPGTFTGIGGSGVVQETAGVPITATVEACDSYWNRTPDARLVSIITTDPYANQWPGFMPTPLNLANGVKNFTFRFTTKGTWNITALDADAGPVFLSSQTITGVNVVANSPAKLQILMPDETPADGSLNGKSITQMHQTAGAGFSVTARLRTITGTIYF